MNIRDFMHVILSGVRPDSEERGIGTNGVEESLVISRDPSTPQFDQHRGRCWSNCSAQDDSLTKFIRGIQFYGLLFVFALLFASCSSPSDPPATTSTGEKLTGTVVAFGSASPTSLSPSGIQISIQGTQYNAVADTGGHFEIDNIPAGVYNIIFWKPGYDSMIYPVHHIIGAGTDIINDAYLVQESTDSITMTGASYVFTVSVAKHVLVFDTTFIITPSIDTPEVYDTVKYWSGHDSTVITYDTVDDANGLIVSGKLTGNLAPGNIFVYTSLDSTLFPTSPSPQSFGMTEDSWLATKLNDTAYHLAFQSPQLNGGAFKDTLARDVATLMPYSLPAGQAVYVYAVGHSNMTGLPPTGGEYQHFSTTPFGPAAVRFKYIVP